MPVTAADLKPFAVSLMALVGILLAVIAFLTPVILFRTLSLFTVTGNGARAIIGALGSCSARNGAGFRCAGANLSPKYDLRALPNNAAVAGITRPTPILAVLACLAFICSGVFFVTLSMLLFRKSDMGPKFRRVNAWTGFVGWFFGLLVFFIYRMLFGQAAHTFNKASGNGRITAQVGNGFIMAWVAHGFLAVPVILSILKSRQAGGSGGKAGAAKPKPPAGLPQPTRPAGAGPAKPPAAGPAKPPGAGPAKPPAKP